MKKILLTIGVSIIVSNVFAQISVRGIITSSKSKVSVTGVSVRVKGTTTRTFSEKNGRYQINAPSDGILIFEHWVYGILEDTINGRTSIDVQLTPKTYKPSELYDSPLGIPKNKNFAISTQKIEHEELFFNNELNVSNTIIGRVAGYNALVTSSGKLGSVRATLRGNNSLTHNTQPLYVVDGVPIDNTAIGNANDNNLTSIEHLQDFGGGIADINIEDIESITVLKGANAAVLYGIRGANGAILITTKKAEESKDVIGVSYSYTGSIEMPLIMPKFQNSFGQGTGGVPTNDANDVKNYPYSWGGMLDGSEQFYYTGEQKPYTAQPNNVSDFFTIASTHRNTLELSQATKKSNVRFSYTNVLSDDILPNTSSNQHNFNFRLNSDFLYDALNLDARVTYFDQSATQRPVLGESVDNPMTSLFLMPRNINVNDLKTYQHEDTYQISSYSEGMNNPYWIQENNSIEDRRRHLHGYTKLTYEMTDFLSAFVRTSGDITSHKISELYPFGHLTYSDGKIVKDNYDIQEINSDFLLMYNQNFGDFNITANLGGNYYNRNVERTRIVGLNYGIPQTPNIENVENISVSELPFAKSRIYSAYLNGMATYKNIVWLDAILRSDWASTLPKDDNMSLYYGVRTGVLFHQMAGIDRTVISQLKLVGGWATAGNVPDPYQTTAFTFQSPPNQNAILQPNRVLYNENLKPENTSSVDIGTEISLLKNTIYSSFYVYHSTSKDLIITQALPEFLSHQKEVVNGATLVNKGLEFSIGGVFVNTETFNWSSSVNLAKNITTLTELLDESEIYRMGEINDGEGNTLVFTGVELDDNYGNIYGTKLKTINGRILVDEDGNPMIEEGALLGNYLPSFTGGFSNYLRFRDFSLSFLIDFRVGGKAYSFTDAQLDYYGVSENSKNRDNVKLSTIQNVGTEQDPNYEEQELELSKQEYLQTMARISENHMKSLTSIRLREIVLSYHLPVLANTVSGMSISFFARNLLYLYKSVDVADPEAIFGASNSTQGVLYDNVPSTKSMGLNFRITF